MARAADKEVCICGEMASDPLATLLLVGMGLDELSLSPLFIPVVRKAIREVDYQTARLIARETPMGSVQEIKGYLVERYRDLGSSTWSRCTVSGALCRLAAARDERR